MHFDNKIIMMVMYFENYHCDVSFEGVACMFCTRHSSSRGVDDGIRSEEFSSVPLFCFTALINGPLQSLVSPSRLDSPGFSKGLLISANEVVFTSVC